MIGHGLIYKSCVIISWVGASIARGWRYTGKQLPKADILTLFKLWTQLSLSKSLIFQLWKNYGYRKMHQILSDKYTAKMISIPFLHEYDKCENINHSTLI